MMVRILSATAEEIIIDGVVPIDEVAPIRASDGKVMSPDPLIRICHEAKKELLKNGACVTYSVLRPATNGDPSITKIKFIFSCTGKYEPSKTASREKLRKTEDFFCQVMSDRCAHKIVKYFDDKYLITKNSPF